MDFTVVIAAKDAEQTLGRCLDAVAAQQRAPIEVIVVNDGSTDRTGEIAAAHGARVIHTEGCGPGAARNRGVAIARSELVAFTDADCIPRSDWLAELERGFVSPEIAGVGGSQESATDDTAFGQTVHQFLAAVGFVGGYTKRGQKLRPVQHNPSCNSAYRRQLLLDVGGFDEQLFPGEDVDLDLRLTESGFRLFYNPTARVEHYRPSSWRAFGTMMFRYGLTSGGLLTRRYGMYRPLCLEPALLILALIATCILGASDLRWLAALGAVAIVGPVLAFLVISGGAAWRMVPLFWLTLWQWNRGFLAGFFSDASDWVPNER